MKKNLEKLSFTNGIFTADNGFAVPANRITVEDDLARRFYASGETSPDWTLSESTAVKDGLVFRTFRIEALPGKAFRSVSLDLLLEYPVLGGGLAGWNVWTGHRDFPLDVFSAGGRKIYYGDVCYGTVLPVFSLYDSGNRNRGLTVAADPGNFSGGRMAFEIGHYYEEGIHVRFENLALSEKHPVEVRLIFFAHCGCYRPAFARFIELYPEYFHPADPSLDRQMVFGITNPFTRKEYIRQSKMEFSEIHNHFPFYGEYSPVSDGWESVVKHDYPELSAEVPGKITHEKVNALIDSLQENGTKALLYIQLTGDGLLPWAEKHFASSMARDRHGRFYDAWKECCMVNGDPSTPFGRHIGSMVKRFLKQYPGIDGVFLDQMGYLFFDFAHDDGKSAVDNRPVYFYGMSYWKHLEKLAEHLHRNNKLILGNGPYSLRVARYTDGIMAEGTGGLSETLKYLCPRKTLLMHTYPTDPGKVEAMFHYALRTAAAISVGGSSTVRRPAEFSEEVKTLFAKYMPLVRSLRGSQVLLEAAPLSLEPGYAGEIFRSSSGEYKIAVCRERASALQGKTKITALMPEGKGRLDVRVRGTADSRWKKTSFLPEGNKMTVLLDGKSNAYVVEIARKQSR